MSPTNRKTGADHKRGQMLVMFLVMTVTLILVVGLAIDAGNVYVTKAALSKAVDSCVINSVRNLWQGQNVAAAYGQAFFNANFRGAGSLASPATLTLTFTNDASKNLQINADAVAVLNTYFMRLLPQFRTFTVTASARAMRSKLIMSLVLDRSGSMSNNGGAAALPGAVSTFVGLFDDNMDTVGMVSFASTYGTNVTIRQPFKNVITTGAKALTFDGATFADGGLVGGLAMNQSVVTPAGQNVFRAVVFFTDGLANTFQYTWPPNRTYNVGGTDPPQPAFVVMRPNDGVSVASATVGPPTANPNFPDCPGMARFVSITGTNTNLKTASARLEGKLRALNTANDIRNAGITVYSIGLGSNVDESFLHQIANDPSSISYNSTQPVGQAVIAPTSAQLQQVFQDIASRIMLRLTQ